MEVTRGEFWAEKIGKKLCFSDLYRGEREKQRKSSKYNILYQESRHFPSGRKWSRNGCKSLFGVGFRMGLNFGWRSYYLTISPSNGLTVSQHFYSISLPTLCLFSNNTHNIHNIYAKNTLNCLRVCRVFFL